jgi:hypothetical protein
MTRQSSIIEDIKVSETAWYSLTGRIAAPRLFERCLMKIGFAPSGPVFH